MTRRPVVILHCEMTFFSGAQMMLGYFLRAAATRLPIVVAVVPTSKVLAAIPPEIPTIALPENQSFSLFGLARQIRHVTRALADQGFSPRVVHGWTARDWELTATLARVMSRPGIGSLHDDPGADFISYSRRSLMRLSVTLGLDRVICVSEALRSTCIQARYPSRKLACIPNGLPAPDPPSPPRSLNALPVRLGYLGPLSPRKGLDQLFATLDLITSADWTLTVAGEAMSEADSQWLDTLKRKYQSTAWWPRVRWVGWIAEPSEFFASIALLMVPSTQFDPYPTVLLEAARAGIPAFASEMGGVPEIVDAETGWLIAAGGWPVTSANTLERIFQDPSGLTQRGVAAGERFMGAFSVDKMVGRYQELYDSVDFAGANITHGRRSVSE